VLRVTLKGLLAHKIRFLLTGLAVTLGVSFMVGTLVLTDTVQKVFDDLFANIYDSTDAVVRGPKTIDTDFGDQRANVPASMLVKVRAVPGVQTAEGNVQVNYAQIVGRDGDPIGNPGAGPPTFGFNWQSSPLNPFHIVEGRPPRTSDEVVINRSAADDGDLRLGDQVTILSNSAPRRYALVGIAKFGTADSTAGATTSLFTTAEAQRLGGQPGEFDDISVIADRGLSQEAIRDRLAKALEGEKVEVVTGAKITKENQDAIKRNLGFFTTALLTFAVVALIVGAFIIYNTFSIVVAQRTRELALLRALGASRGQVRRSVLGESVGVGLAASALGIGFGILVSAGLKALLAAFGLDIPGAGVVVQARSVVVAVVVGSLVTIVSAWIPARRAARLPPIAAMRDVAIERPTSLPVRSTIGGLVTALGVAVLVVGLTGSIDPALLYVGLGAFLVFIGVFVLGPLIARPFAQVLGTKPVAIAVVGVGALLMLGAVVVLVASLVSLAPAGVIGAVVLAWVGYTFARSGRGGFGITGRIARENAVRNPRRTAATAAALMIGVALVGFITIFAASAKKSISSAIDKQITSDYVVTTGTNFGGPGSGLSPSLVPRLREVPELAAVTGIRFGVFELAAKERGKKGTTEFLVASDPRASERMFDFDVREGSLGSLSVDGVAVSKRKADKNHWKVGDRISATFAKTGPQTLTIDAIYKRTDIAGDYLTSISSYEKNFNEQLDFQVFAQLRPGADAEAARAGIEQVLKSYPSAKLRDQKQYKDDYAANINQIVNLIYALLGLAVVIALIGIANTLALSIYERTREIGLMRAVGMTKPQTRVVVRWESVIISLLGTGLGLAIGLFFGWAVVTALRSQGFTSFSFAPVQLAVVIVIASVAGTLAAIRPARRAANLDVLQAIAYE
jgi:putative ABC transport system permease protein